MRKVAFTVKISKYNFLKNYDDVTIFFNSKTCALAVVDENFLKILNDIEVGNYDKTNYDSQLIKDMKFSGCIVEDDIDEVERLEFFRNVSKYDMTSLGLTIAPTLDCNFRCKYCYEKHPKGIMNEETQKKLIEFAEQRLTLAKSLSVTWYGGEPLLAKDVVYNLSEKFIELCQRLGISYDAFMVTNASLMTDEDVENFKKYKINGVQITIDGPKEIHDKRRLHIKNESTFDKLIDRVNVLLNNDLNVIVRINIDKENINRVEELLDSLKARIDKHSKLKIDFGHVTAFTEICKSIESDCYNNEQYADIMLPLYAKVNDYGFTVKSKPPVKRVVLI